MNIIVDEPAQYEAWLAKQKTVGETMSIPVADIKIESTKVIAEKK